jgi:anti-sigma regulatory factor (Ser/Thr protein kinase)
MSDQDPTSPGDFRLSLLARPENVAVVRHVLGVLVESMGVHRAVVEDVRLAVTEACTNVVRHAYDETPGPMEVEVNPGDDAVEVVVSDHGRGLAGSRDGGGPHLGMPLMAALADSIEVDQHAGIGSRVAMSFSRGSLAASVPEAR